MLEGTEKKAESSVCVPERAAGQVTKAHASPCAASHRFCAKAHPA